MTSNRHRRSKPVRRLRTTQRRKAEVRSRQTPLMIACAKGDVTQIKALIAMGATIDYVNREKETALTYAVVWNRLDVIKILLKHGANPEIPTGRWWSPLMYAAREGNEAAVTTLVKYGADIQRRDGYGLCVADIAAVADHKRLASRLRQRKAYRAKAGTIPKKTGESNG